MSETFADLLGIHATDPIALADRVEKGFRFAALEMLRKKTRLPTQALAEAVSINPRTLQRRRKEGRFEPEESDRLLRFSRVFGKAIGLFEGDADAARRWISTSSAALEGRAPIELARTDPGAREVEALIDRLETGVLS